MSELGIGDEKFGFDDADVDAKETESLAPEIENESKSGGDLDAMQGMPVVVIRGFEDKVGGKSEFLDVIAQWATGLVENRVSGPHTSLLCELSRTTPRLGRTCYRVER